MRTILSHLFLAAAAWGLPPAAAEPLGIGIAAPLSGTSATLGRQVAAGAVAAATVAGPARVRLNQVDDACSADGGRAAAERFVAAGVAAATGFLCAESLLAAMPILAAAKIPVITVGVRANSLTDERTRTGWVVARLGPRADGERLAAGRLVAQFWSGAPFAILDDGTIYGRDLAEGVREADEAAGGKPVFTDTFRPRSDNQAPTVERLAQAGAQRAFVGGERDDIAILQRDAAAAGVALALAGGETLRDDPGPVGLAVGTLMVGLPEAADNAAPEALAAIRAGGSRPDGYALPAFAAVEIIEKALTGTATQGSSPFDGRTFGTAIGPVGFDGKGDLAQNPFRLFRFDGRRFVALELP